MMTNSKGDKMTNGRLVDIHDATGNRIYSNLIYRTGDSILLFKSGYGFIDRYDVQRYGWKIVPRNEHVA